MNKIWILCFAVLIITIPFSTQESPNENRSGSASGGSTSPSTNSSAVGLGPVPTTLYLLIPAATLGFIHTQYMLN
ncbi:hypothetical protein ABG768_009929 [Culter alburnus]|uniref:Uncharacterized protein n=1 Tax=Culter alburnus TaxID=194366 RepID=A0AAW1ZGI0_CULAL